MRWWGWGENVGGGVGGRGEGETSSVLQHEQLRVMDEEGGTDGGGGWGAEQGEH